MKAAEYLMIRIKERQRMALPQTITLSERELAMCDLIDDAIRKADRAHERLHAIETKGEYA